MIISKTNTIEGMKIVKNLGYIEAKPKTLSWDTRKSARINLEKEAEKLGANAIIGFKVQESRPLLYPSISVGTVASGDAVVVKEI